MTDPSATYIAMWSGPRNISTAMMRSWDSRPDTFVCDEPFYAYYLRRTGTDHPGRDEVLASQKSDWQSVVEQLTGNIPEGKSIFYQKHMAHHLLPDIGREWLDQVTNAFLIRDPHEMLTSLLRVMPRAEVGDTGLPQQWEIFERERNKGDRTPVVVDARDVLEHPREILERLCTALGVPFLEAMLSWEPGTRKTDGVWARYWYERVERSSGFEAYSPKMEGVPEAKRDVLDACVQYYERLYEYRLKV